MKRKYLAVEGERRSVVVEDQSVVVFRLVVRNRIGEVLFATSNPDREQVARAMALWVYRSLVKP